MNVAIAGATGLVGSRLLQLLEANSGVSHILAVGRNAPSTTSEKVEFVRSTLGASPELSPTDAALCCLGTTIKKAGSQAAFREVDLAMVVNFARAANLAGARHFGVVSALGANAKSRVFYNRVKGEAEEALKSIGFESLVIVRPSFLLGDRPESRPGERVGIAISRILAPLMVGPARRLRPVAAEAVAKTLMSTTLQSRTGTKVIESECIA